MSRNDRQHLAIDLIATSIQNYNARSRWSPHPGPEAFEALTEPGFAKAAMNLLIEPDGAGGSVLKTETRVFATDASSRRRFAAYWRVIYPGSALIRIMWLRAIKQRAEHAAVP